MNQFKQLLLLCLAALTLSAASFAADTAAQGSAAKEGSSDYVSDSWITTKVKAALLEDSRVKATEVNVETYKGIVQLSGFVSSEAALQQAIVVARGIKGVSSVKNNMRVK
jgi:osmotically-inducible protein OsmY